MSTGNTAERRSKERTEHAAGTSALLWLERPDGSWHKIQVVVQDSGERGAGILLGEALEEGARVLLDGAGVTCPDGSRARGTVVWCRSVSAGAYRAGIAIEDTRKEPAAKAEEFVDLYEILEVNPAASADTIHKVYRMLAHRMHPDNLESGSEEGFKRLTAAYRILSDPEKRAAYDVTQSRESSKRWRIFDPETAVPGLEQEQRKRRAILAALYKKRMRNPENPGVSIPELEQLLAVPREHLEFSLWFQKEQGWIVRTDGGKHHITAKGVEYAESTGAWQPPSLKNSGLISSGQAQ